MLNMAKTNVNIASSKRVSSKINPMSLQAVNDPCTPIEFKVLVTNSNILIIPVTITNAYQLTATRGNPFDVIVVALLTRSQSKHNVKQVIYRNIDAQFRSLVYRVQPNAHYLLNNLNCSYYDIARFSFELDITTKIMMQGHC